MRTALVLIALALSPAAFAGDIEMTGVDAFDDVFRKVRTMDEKLDSAKKSIKDGRKSLATALGMADTSTLEEGLQELKKRAEGKLEVVKDGETPKLAAKDAVPSDVQAGIDAVNAMTESLGASLTTLRSIPDDAKAAAAEVRAMPGKLKEDRKDLGVKLKDVPAVTKKVTGNTKETGELPDRSKSVLDEAVKTLDLVATTFTSSGDPSPGEPAEAEREAATPAPATKTADGAAKPKPKAKATVSK